jgi:hypothetical protein
MSKYTGAGIFIIENYNGKPVILLFGKNNKFYSDAGGNIDKDETPEETACRETREETANLINIKPIQLENISKKVIINSYISYFIYIDKIKTRDYYNNVEIIFDKCKEYFWKESNCIARIYLDEFFEKIKTYDFNAKKITYIKDIHDKHIQIRPRVLFIIKEGMNVLKNVNSMKITNFTPKITINSKIDCIIGTTSYIIEKKN